MVSGFSLRSLESGSSDRKHVPLLRIAKVQSFLIGLFPLLKKLRLRHFATGLFLFVLLYFAILWFTLPNLDDPRSLIAAQSTVITDREGVELYRLFQEEDRTFVEAGGIPEHMKQAIIAIEDERFYEHGCIDMRAIVRALLVNVFRFERQGASTITQQLARNAMYLTREKRLSRKLKEIILACQLESRFSKAELLELYLNWIPFGENAYGIEQASQQYFGISAEKLTLAQSAVLAALPQRPSYFSPYGRHVRTTVSQDIEERVRRGEITRIVNIPEDAISPGLLGGMIGTGTHTLAIGGRTDQVLRNMQDLGSITEAERLQALEHLETISFQPSRETIRAPHFVLWIREQVQEMFAGTVEEGLLEAGGLTIETTLDWDIQQAAEEAVARYREDVLDRFGAHNIALVTIDNATRGILAYVGNANFGDEEHGGKIDMVRVPRQPGSSFKPFVYASAFQRGYSPASVIYDVPTKIGDDEPQNFDGRFWGLLTIRQALGASRNLPAAKTFFLAGGENAILSLISAMGAPTPAKRRQELKEERPEGFDYGWPLALGAAETPLLEMAHGYSTFAGGGRYTPLQNIRRITDKQGNILFEVEDVEPEQVLDERIAYQITSVLSDESVRPNEYWRTQLTVPGFETAAKTGTSNKCLEWKEFKEGGKDRKVCKLRKPDNAWVMGYTPMITVGAWAGNADSTALYEKGDGLNTVSPIWHDFMIAAHRTLENPRTQFERPDGLIQVQISTLSGELPTDCTPVPYRRADVFLTSSPPTQPDPGCAQLVVDRVTHLLASDECPAEARESGSFLVVQGLLPERFPEWQKGTDAWVKKQMEMWYATPDHSGAIIPLPVAPTEKCDPSLTPGRLEKPAVDIVSPAADKGASYPSFRPKITYKAASSVREVTYFLDGRKVTTVTEAPFEATVRVPKAIPEEGEHELRVLLIDRYFNQVEDTVRFHFEEDASGPRVRIIEPSADVTMKTKEKLVIHVEAEDPDGGLKYVQFFLGSTLLTTKPSEPFELMYTVKEKPGTYELRVVATDLAGNTEEDSVTIRIEN